MKTTPMLVTLVDHMGSDLSVVNAARVSFDKESELDFEEVGHPASLRYFLKDSDAKLIGYLAKHNHWSPFAHTSIQLRVKAPVFCARQLVKHQVGGVWNEVSRRYVDSEPEFYFPEVWRGRPVNAKQGSSGIISNPEYWDRYVRENVTALLLLYTNMIDNGVAPEQARMVLPQNMQTEWYWTGSLMFYCRVCRERLAPGAQKETRDVAEQIAEIVAPLYPVAWSALMES